MTGTNGTLIPAGSLVRDTNSTITVATDEDVTISGGVAEVDSTATVTGPLTADAGTMTVIVNPIVGWSTVTNSSAGVTGRNTETDEELRVRRADSTASGKSNVEAIYSRILDIDDVTFVRVYVNEECTVDSRGITPKSVAAVVVGGADADVAAALFPTVAGGIKTYGNTSETVIDDQDFAYPISFTRPPGVPIYVELEIDAFDNFPEDGEERIKQAIVDYAAFGADFFGCTDGNQDGFPPGENVILSRLFTPINTVDNHTVKTLRIGKSLGTLSTIDLEINFDEISSWSTTNIDITINYV
jgi:uncharacterized phage protein gp47/JayE